MSGDEFRAVLARHPELVAGLPEHLDEVTRICGRIIEMETTPRRPPGLPPDAPEWDAQLLGAAHGANVRDRPLAIALTLDERNLLVSLVFLGEELGADTDLTRPVLEMLNGALDLGDQAVREVFTSQSFFAEAARVVA